MGGEEDLQLEFWVGPSLMAVDLVSKADDVGLNPNS